MLIGKIFKSDRFQKVLNLKETLDINRRLQNISKIFKKSKESPKELPRSMLVVEAFKKKRNDHTYEMPETAKKVYEAAKKITEESHHDKILEHGLEYAFLTSDRHYFHKHIETLVKWNGPKNSKVIIDNQNNVILRTYKENAFNDLCHKHKVMDLIKTTKQNPELEYDLTYYSLNEKQRYPAELNPSFKIEGDGHYHVAIVTDCPTNELSLSGHHAWLRLIDPKGNVISVGKFPKKIRSPFLYAKEATVFSSSDRHEWLCRNNTIKEHRFLIDEKKFLALKKDILKDLKAAANQNDPNKQDFNFFKENCSDWTIEKVSKIGINIKKKKIQVDQFTLLFPKFSKWHNRVIPKESCLRGASNKIRSTLSLLTLQVARIAMIFFLGGRQRNKENINSKKFINKPRQIFDPTLTKVTHPLKLRRYLDQELSLS